MWEIRFYFLCDFGSKRIASEEAIFLASELTQAIRYVIYVVPLVGYHAIVKLNPTRIHKHYGTLTPIVLDGYLKHKNV